MASEVRFESKEWDAMIKKINDSVKDPKPLLRAAFATRGFRDIIQHFEQEKGPDGQWKRSKRAEREGGKTLQDTGNLRNGFLPGNISNKGKDAIVFFNPVPYSGQHDEGTDGMPQREFMYLTDDAQEDMLNIILDQIVK